MINVYFLFLNKSKKEGLSLSRQENRFSPGLMNNRACFWSWKATDGNGDGDWTWQLASGWVKSKISCHKQVAFRGGWPSWLLRSRDKKMKAMEYLAEDPWPSNHHYRRERKQMGLCFGTATIPRSQFCLLPPHMSSKYKHSKVLVG